MQRGITGIDKEYFLELFQVAEKSVLTPRLCRTAFRKTGVYPYNPQAVLKDLPELRTHENRTAGTKFTADSAIPMEISSGNGQGHSHSVIARPWARGPPATPQNTKGVGVHAPCSKTLTIYLAKGLMYLLLPGRE